MQEVLEKAIRFYGGRRRMEWLAQIFRANPIIPIFLTLGLGFWIGKLKYKSFSLGPVAATLLVGVLIGQLQIKIPDLIKSLFFMLFLFSIGYSVGPQFFRSFRGAGIKQVIFAFMEALICAFTVVAAAKIMGYDMGAALGMFAGSQTASGSLGVTTETIRNLDMAVAEKDRALSLIPTCYAVTYVFGTIGSAWFLSNIGPWLLGGLEKVKEETSAIEEEMDSGEFHAQHGYMNADRPVSFRAYKAESPFFDKPRTVAEIEKMFADKDMRVFVERLRARGEIREPAPDSRVRKGDAIVLSARREAIVEIEGVGPEVADHELLSFEAEKLPVTIAKSGPAGMTLGELRAQPYMRGVIVRNLSRNNMALPARAKTRLHRGDQLTLVGLPRDVIEAAEEIGYADRKTVATDMVFLGLGLALGAFIGALSFKFHGIPVSVSSSGGVLLSGLFLGWLRDARPSFGRIPSTVVWFLDNIGLNMFIAIVGITSGATFLSGLHSVGYALFFVGVICTLVPLTLCIFIGRKIFRFSCAETLGCVAGSRCGVASIGAILDALDSDLPAVGYTVTYAVANLILVFSSLIVMACV